MVKCEPTELSEIISYIGKRYGECPYMYVDLCKYGMENENVNVWKQEKNGAISVLILQYYTGTHIFSGNGDFDAEDVCKLLDSLAPSLICGMKETVDKIKLLLPKYKLDVGIIGHLADHREFNTDGCYCASIEELEEAAHLMEDDESLGKPYGFEMLHHQLKDRFLNDLGRTFILRKDGKIIATASTYAEQAKVAVVSGVFVDHAYRRKGLSKIILSALCHELAKNDMDVFSFYYLESAHKMHASVGFDDMGEWGKLIRLD